MLGGDLPAVAAAALTGGQAALSEFTLRVGQPGRARCWPRPRPESADALERLGGEGGFRGQARRRPGPDPPRRRRRVDLHPQPRRRHRPAARGRRGHAGATGDRPDRRRRGDRAARRRASAPLPGHRVAVRPWRGRAQRPQLDVAAARAAQPLSVFFFDILHLDGVDLLDAPTRDRACRRSTRSCRRNSASTG